MKPQNGNDLHKVIIQLEAVAKTKIQVTRSTAAFVWTQEPWEVEDFDPKHLIEFLTHTGY